MECGLAHFLQPDKQGDCGIMKSAKNPPPMQLPDDGGELGGGSTSVTFTCKPAKPRVHVLGRHGMRILALFFLLFSPRLRAQNATQEVATLIIIAGAPGEEEYGKAFSEWAALWDKAGAQSGAKTISIGLKAVEGTTDRDRLQKTLETEAKESANELWLVLIG